LSDVQLRRHQNFRSKILRNQRDLVVYLPPGYQEQPDRRFPVLYMHDGQNLFDGATSFVQGQDWHVGHSADAEIRAGRVEPLIIVGIYNVGKARIQEYTPTKAPRLGGGRADRYGRFLLDEVMPFVNSQYRVQLGPQNTGIGGSSLGGLVSLFIGLSRPDVFGKIAALSPSVWWNQRVIHTFTAGMNVESRPRIWLDIGTREGPRIVEDVERYRDILVRRGWQCERDLHYERLDGAEHNEAAWAQRVAPFLRFLYPAR
jgi:predicted alpha/beta superfamily hydrolase